MIPAVSPPCPARCDRAWQKEKAKGKMAVHQGTGMTSCCPGAKYHEAARTSVFTDHICPEQRGEGIAAGYTRQEVRGACQRGTKHCWEKHRPPDSSRG